MKEFSKEERDGFKKHLVKAYEKTLPYRIKELEGSIDSIYQKKDKWTSYIFNKKLKEKLDRIQNLHNAIELLKSEVIPTFDTFSNKEAAYAFSFFHSFTGKKIPSTKEFKD